MATTALRNQVVTQWQTAFARLNHDRPGITGLIEFSHAWGICTRYLQPWNINETPPQRIDIDVAREAYNTVNQCKRQSALVENFLQEVRKRFSWIEDEILAIMGEYETEDVVGDVMSRLVKRVLLWYRAWEPPEEFGSTIRAAYTSTFQTYLFGCLPPSFTVGFKALCAFTFPRTSPSDPDSSSAEADISVSPTLHDVELWDTFESLGLLDRFENIIASVGYECIEKHVVDTCSGKWSEPVMPELHAWMMDKVVPWMLLMYARGATTEEARAMLTNVGSRFDFHMAKTLCDLRTREIFDIIIDHPESNGALTDLKECLQRVDQRAALVSSLRKANRRRLLHPGADTRLILAQYVATIKCLRIIDPPGVLLFKVADPIRRYLRERPDTIRCIVANLVGDDDSGDALVDESEPIVPLQQSDTEDYSDPNWEPEPIDAGPEFRTNKPSDVISTLVSIYDSKDLFVKELQVLLAQRLLAISDDDMDKVEKERRNIEILKIRFGEAALQVCEVMLKDMTDSKRIDGHVQSQKASIVHPTIISRHFWPLLDSGDIAMPGQFQKLQEQYAKEFSTFKPDKKLQWLPHLGNVHLELSLEDRTLEVDVPPLEAAFIELFSDKSVWTVDELIAKVGAVDKSAALRALMTWVDHGVIKETGDGTFELLEVAEATQPGGRRPKTAVPTPLESMPMTTPQQQQAEQMRIHWNFIQGMLTNLSSLPLDRIHSMLKFAPDYDQTIEQLGAFMEAARREGLVVVRDGMWSLAPK